jgi:hypothetical protein
MQRTWTNRNVNLRLFADKIREFLEKNEFDLTFDESENTYVFIARGSPEYRIDGQAKVTLSGNPQDFSIMLEIERTSHAKKYSMPITLAASLGLGLLLRDEFKSDEEFLNLRKDLWAFSDRVAINLTGSGEMGCQTEKSMENQV